MAVLGVGGALAAAAQFAPSASAPSPAPSPTQVVAQQSASAPSVVATRIRFPTGAIGGRFPSFAARIPVGRRIRFPSVGFANRRASAGVPWWLRGARVIW
ncbi:MAG: hypothetical protein V3U03_15825 [Myxococcota bacterium]